MTDTTHSFLPGALAARLFDWLDARGGLARPAFAFLVGLLLSRAFSPVNFFPALFIAIPAMILILDRVKGGRDAFKQGWWVGFGLFMLGMKWVGHSFAQQDAVPAELAPLAVIIMAAGLALYVGLTFWVAWRLWPKGLFRIVYFAAVWTLFEVARGTWFTGLPWLLVGSAWADWLSVAQSVLWLSVYGLTFVSILAAGSLVAFFDGLRVRHYATAIAGIVVMVVIAIAGYQRLDNNGTRYHLPITMRLVQANIPQKEKWKSNLIDDHFDKYLRLSRRSDPAGKARGVRLVIWPETAVQRESFDRDGSLQRWRASRVLEYGSFLLTGAPRYEYEPGETRFYNSLMAINSKADLYARYDKVKLVPFGEYVPFAGLLNAIGLQQLAGDASFTPGDVHQTISLPGVPSFSPLVCYEIIFPGEAFAPGNRPEWLLNITNDGWFGFTDGPYQHLALARLRAIEEGLPVVRSAGTGISAVIDAYGRIINQLGLGRQGTLESPLPQANEAPAIPTGVRILFFLFLSAAIIMVRMWFHARPNDLPVEN